MTEEQRCALKNIFPRIKTKDILLLDDAGNQLPSGRENLAVSLFGSGAREVLSLRALAALSLLRHMGQAKVGDLEIPDSDKRYLNSF